MQKFILLRGHEGSGKSTFATQKIAEFQHAYPNATLVHIDNDHDLTDENGIYHFDFEKFAAAHQRNMAWQQATFELGKREPQRDILLINTNPNQKAKTCMKQLAMAREHDFVCEIYRLHNFFTNLHGVSEDDVLRGYARLNANPVAGEIHIAPIRPMTAQQRLRLMEMMQAA